MLQSAFVIVALGFAVGIHGFAAASQLQAAGRMRGQVPRSYSSCVGLGGRNGYLRGPARAGWSERRGRMAEEMEQRKSRGSGGFSPVSFVHCDWAWWCVPEACPESGRVCKVFSFVLPEPFVSFSHGISS